jgi:serine/threonine protein kinase
MAPEIMRGESYDESSDVYSYGTILWELFNKEIPWNGQSMIDLIDQVGYQQKPLRLKNAKKTIFAELIEKCLQWKREMRPSFKEILDQIQ